MKTILVADDEECIRTLIRQVLESPDCQVVEACDAIEALALTRSAHPDVLVLDRKMPGMDGLEVVRQLRNDAATAEIPVILMSGVEQDDCYMYARSLGVGGCLYKPFRPVQLLLKIQDLLSQAPRLKPHPDAVVTHSGAAAHHAVHV